MSFDCQLINSSWCKVVRNLILINYDEGLRQISFMSCKNNDLMRNEERV